VVIPGKGSEAESSDWEGLRNPRKKERKKEAVGDESRRTQETVPDRRRLNPNLIRGSDMMFFFISPKVGLGPVGGPGYYVEATVQFLVPCC